MKRVLLTPLVAFCLCVAGNRVALSAQSGAGSVPQIGPVLDSRAARIKDRVEKLGIRREVTVILLDGREYHGTIKSVEAAEFLVAEVDLRQLVTVGYDEVNKVRKGYGGMNYATGRRVNPRTNLIAGAAALAGIILVPIILLSQDK